MDESFETPPRPQGSHSVSAAWREFRRALAASSWSEAWRSLRRGMDALPVWALIGLGLIALFILSNPMTIALPLGAVVFLVALHYVIRNAVLAALREHDLRKMRTSQPDYRDDYVDATRDEPRY